jgi:hypothetical protein
MLCRRLWVPRRIGLWAAFPILALGILPGCDVLNPALFGTVTSSSIPSLSAPEGTILVAVLNTTSAIAAARVRVTKNNGGTVDLVLPVQQADNDPANEADRALAVQDCDVASIQLIEVLAAPSTGGAVQQFGSDLPLLIGGVHINCGKVVVISILGTPPNLLVNMQVY